MLLPPGATGNDTAPRCPTARANRALGGRARHGPRGGADAADVRVADSGLAGPAGIALADIALADIEPAGIEPAGIEPVRTEPVGPCSTAADGGAASDRRNCEPGS